MTLREQWASALDGLEIAHIDPAVRVSVEIADDDPPVLTMACHNVRDTSHLDKRMPILVVSCVRLTYFPGAKLAREWIAAAWAGYQCHEALELVRAGGRNPLDPHADPYPDAPCNRGLRDGLPLELTPTSLLRALCVVMDYAHAERLTAEVH